MAYVIDANCFVEANQRFYRFDFCPGFWEWLLQQNAAGYLHSIMVIKKELQDGNDDLARWARQRNDGFFLPCDDAKTLECVKRLSEWANTADFTAQAKAEFMGSVDLRLVAYAMAHGHTIVTHERLNPHQRNKVKIPKACEYFNVPYTDLFDLLGKSGVEFVLSGQTKTSLL